MGQNIFKKGDRVYNHLLGWGYITKTADEINQVIVLFDSGPTCDYRDLLRFKELSFTEYTLQGFSQERPEELPKIGQVVWVRDEFPSEWTVGHFFKKDNGKYYISYNPSLNGWSTNGTEIKTINPYKNEQ
jgi:hypothetical protein